MAYPSNKIICKEGDKMGNCIFLKEVNSINDKNKKRKGLFKCYCGKEFISIISEIKSERTKSCGCLRDLKSKERATKHGLNRTPEVMIFEAMKGRCYNKNNKAYKNYGGRGIKICDRWLEEDGVQNFLKDMGNKPTKNHSIDRIDNNGDYSPENCRWVERGIQNRNKRSNVFIEYEGKRLCIADWCKETGLDKETIRRRLKSNLPPEEIFRKNVRVLYAKICKS